MLTLETLQDPPETEFLIEINFRCAVSRFDLRPKLFPYL